MTEEPIQSQVASLCESYGVRLSEQALSVLTAAAEHSHAEFIGDSDSLLAGLLLSGSYTVDIMEQAGANPFQLRNLAVQSVQSSPVEVTPEEFDRYLHGLLGNRIESTGILDYIADSGKTLEAADVLRAAIDPSPEEEYIFPFNLRDDAPPDGKLDQDLEHALGEILTYCVTILLDNERAPGEGTGSLTWRALTERRRPITPKEDARLDKRLGLYYPDMDTDELEFLIAALNQWFQYRRILRSPTDVCSKVVSRMSSMLFGPQFFATSGGDFGTVEHGLLVAKKFASERDDMRFVLSVDAEGRIRAGEYTYRNTLATSETLIHRAGAQGVTISALRPVPLVSSTVISGLEDLLNNTDAHEKHYQHYLSMHPEILAAMGYGRALPHVILSQESADPLIPDFLLTIPGQRGFDILDLKLPSAALLARHPHVRMSYEITKAIAQLRRYQKFFNSSENRKAFEQRHGLLAFRPQVMVVIGRDTHFHSLDERMEIEEQAEGLRIVTYDDLLAYAHARRIL